MTQDPQVALKQAAAERAVEFVQSGMVVGLGTGSTAIFATRRIGALLRDGTLRDVSGFPTSKATADEARALGIPLLDDDLPTSIDVTIDGADEVDPQLELIKGGGGALLREKIVAQASRREIIVVDESKLSPVLGTRWALPIQVIPFGWRSQARFIEGLGGRVVVRQDGHGAPFRTDRGSLILDCAFGPIAGCATGPRRPARRAGGHRRARTVSRHQRPT
jgi:ribose 5-phosphate isomerase A